MRERAFTLMCALGALALFVMMFVHREGVLGSRNDVPRPATPERRGNGYHAALSWLEAEKIPTVSLREHFDRLSSLEHLAPTGNLLVVTLPSTSGIRSEEFVSLDRWVRAGNTLLVLAALCDNPDWSASSSGVALADLNLLTGLEFELARRSKAGESADVRRLRETQRSTLIPNREHAYFTGVKAAQALSDYPPRSWRVKVPYEGFVLSLAHDGASGEGALWVRPIGEGRVIVSGFGTLFTNRALGLADNAHLLANIVAGSVQKGGSVLFDDGHQGVGSSYDPSKFYRDKRLYVTLGILVALWFAWVLGSTRLQLPARRRLVPREAELVRTGGEFLARVLPAHAAGLHLFQLFFRRIAARSRQPVAGEPWEVLERHPRVAARDIAQMKAWYADCRGGRRVSLLALYNLLLRIDGQTT